MEPTFDLETLLTYFGITIGIALVLALILVAYVILSVRRINLPPDADFFTALRHTPFVVVLMLDLLDLSLDFFSAPFSWIILGKLGLEPLRAVTVVESILPFTQPLPTMTISWILARVWKNSPRLPTRFP